MRRIIPIDKNALTQRFESDTYMLNIYVNNVHLILEIFVIYNKMSILHEH